VTERGRTRGKAQSEGSHGCWASAQMSAPENKNNRIKAEHTETERQRDSETERGRDAAVPGTGQTVRLIVAAADHWDYYGQIRAPR
jgi:hypothetical protein